MELRPGLFWARTQLPFKPGHINVWLLPDADGWTVIDPGFDSPDHRDAFLALLASLGDPSVARVLVTHAHVDHCSIAGWLCEISGARLAMARTEWLVARLAGSPEDILSHRVLYRSTGCPVAWLDGVADYRLWFAANYAGLPARYERLVDDGTIGIGGRQWRISIGGGHAPEQVMLHAPGDGILIAADHLLPRINPSVMLRAEEPWSDPIGDGLASLDLCGRLPDGTLICPSHGEPCFGIGAIVARTIAHHRARIETVRGMLRAGTTGYDVLRALHPGGRDFANSRIAILESLALLVHLERQGDAISVFEHDGVRRFSPR